MTRELKESCTKIKNTLKIPVDQACVLGTVDRLAEQTIDTISPTELTFRSNRMKRDTKKKHGAIINFILYLFWNDDDSEDTSTPMGVIKHAVSDFKEIENKLQDTQQKYQTELAKTMAQFRTEQEKIFSKVNINIMLERLQALRETTVENILRTKDAYENLQATKMTEAELTKLIKKIETKLDDFQVPRTTLQQLTKICSSTVISEDCERVVNIAVPIVKKEIFTSFFTVPMPTKDNRQLAAFEPHSVIINARLNVRLNARFYDGILQVSYSLGLCRLSIIFSRKSGYIKKNRYFLENVQKITKKSWFTYKNLKLFEKISG
jgi:hypothetical protein